MEDRFRAGTVTPGVKSQNQRRHETSPRTVTPLKPVRYRLRCDRRSARPRPLECEPRLIASPFLTMSPSLTWSTNISRLLTSKSPSRPSFALSCRRDLEPCGRRVSFSRSAALARDDGEEVPQD